MRIKLTIMVIVLLCCMRVWAAQEVIVRNNDKIEVVMSQSDVNRIAVVNDQIKAIFASQDKVHVMPEEDMGQVFVTPRLGLPFTMSLLMRSGATIDLIVKPVKSLSKTLLLRLDKRGDDELAKVARKEEILIKKLIKVALKGRILKGYQVLSHEDQDKDKGLVQRKSYIGSKYKILVFDYKNLKPSSVVVSERMFAMSPDSIAVFVSKKALKPNETTKVVVVEDNKQEIKHLRR